MWDQELKKPGNDGLSKTKNLKQLPGTRPGTSRAILVLIFFACFERVAFVVQEMNEEETENQSDNQNEYWHIDTPSFESMATL